MKKIAFIGTGVMGISMIKNLINASHELHVYNRTMSKALPLAHFGAKVCKTIKECVSDVDIVITIVGYPKDVEEVYNEIFTYAKANTICIDMTTSSPSLAITLHEQGILSNIKVLDAPVSGGDIGALKGTLSIMVGGDISVFEQVLEILEAMGTTINYMGKAGSGQHTKMANQIAIAGAIGGLAETYIYCQKAELDFERVYKAIGKGAAASWQMDNNFTKMIVDNIEPGFFIKHFVKDLKIAQNEAHSVGIQLTVLDEVLRIYQSLEEKGLQNEGTQAIYKYYLD